MFSESFFFARFLDKYMIQTGFLSGDLAMSRSMVEVQFEHSLLVMTVSMDAEDLVKVVITAEVVPFCNDDYGDIDTYGEVQVMEVRVIDDRYPGLIVKTSDITSDEYDKIEDEAYRLVESSSEYDGYYH